MATGEVEITMRDLYVQLNSIKRDFDSNFGSLRMDIETLRLELQRDIKLIRMMLKELKPLSTKHGKTLKKTSPT